MEELNEREQLLQKGLDVYRCNQCNLLFVDLEHAFKITCPNCYLSVRNIEDSWRFD